MLLYYFYVILYYYNNKYYIFVMSIYYFHSFYLTFINFATLRYLLLKCLINSIILLLRNIILLK